MPHRMNGYPSPRRDLEAARMFGMNNLAEAAKAGDFQARKALLEFAESEEERADLLESWHVPFDSFDCQGVIQYA